MTKPAITTLIFDFANVLLFAKRLAPTSSLSRMYSRLSGQGSIWDSYQLNDDALDFLREKKRELRLVIVTSSYNLPQHPEIKPILDEIFDHIFISSDLIYPKSASECYETVTQDLGISPAEAVFVDDSIDNIEAAQAAGLHTIHFSENEQLFKRLAELGIK